MNDVIIESLDTRSTQEWLTLSARTAHACTALSPCAVNEALDSAAQSEPQSPLTPAYRLWMADNLAREGRYLEAIKGFDVAIRSAQSARRFLAAFDPLCCALRSKAQSATLADDAKLAIATYRELAKLTSEAPEALFQAGLIAEQHGSDDQAAELYSSATSPRASTATDDPAELARRARLRLQDARTLYFPHHGALSDRLIQAIERKDIAQLGRIVSKTHFAIGVCGGHTRFEQPEMLEHLYRDLQSSTVTVREHVLGSGDKRYLLTHGWTGAWFVGDVSFLLTRAAKGWQWVGVALSHAHEPWLAHWSAATLETIDATTEAQALPFGLLAPWPSGKRFMAGGQTDYAVKQALVLATPFPANLALAEAFSMESCGFGPRGFYYKAVASHVDEDEFAIDFTKYRLGVPYDNDSGGTPVLATRAGIVVTANAGTPTGSTSASNTVAIVHPEPNNPSATDRFLTRYLHMEGPNKLTVSGGMTVLAGQRLGRMDDTGNSVFNHLHFSIHDKTLPHAKVAYGRSVRPTPMSGATLGDSDSGRCVLSNNVEQVPAVPGVHFKPASLSFGSTVVGDERMVSLTIENTLGRAVTVSFPASTTPPFTWPAFNQTIPDGQTRTHAFQFRPTSEGNASKTLSITSNAPGSPHALQMAGTGRGGLIP